jgi:hypothetical protein
MILRRHNLQAQSGRLLVGNRKGGVGSDHHSEYVNDQLMILHSLKIMYALRFRKPTCM